MPNDTNNTAGSDCQERLVRDCLVTKTDGSCYDGSYRSWQEAAAFHGWTKHARCAVGDGSMIEWVTLAIIEWPDGKVDMCEPCALQFIANETSPSAPK
jgi:major membrane immunogen (membrane-anchored lipoprotein)